MSPAAALYFSPDDDALGMLVQTVSAARHHVRAAFYTFSAPALTDALIAHHAAGRDVAVLLDASQFVGFAAMGREAGRLRAAGVPTLVGTSPQRRIMHWKAAVIDRRILCHGSLNATRGAQREANHLAIESSRVHSAAFLAAFARLWDWNTANTPQTAAGIAAAVAAVLSASES